MEADVETTANIYYRFHQIPGVMGSSALHKEEKMEKEIARFILGKIFQYQYQEVPIFTLQLEM